MNALVLAATAVALGGQPLEPATCGVRETLWIDHYVAALYLPPKGAPSAALRDPGTPKALYIEILDGRFMPGDIPRKWRGTLQKQLDPQTYERLSEAYRGLRRGDRVILEYAPGPGVQVQVNGKLLARLPGHRLIDALLEAWAGDDPLPERLMRIMVKNRCA